MNATICASISEREFDLIYKLVRANKTKTAKGIEAKMAYAIDTALSLPMKGPPKISGSIGYTVGYEPVTRAEA